MSRWIAGVTNLVRQAPPNPSRVHLERWLAEVAESLPPTARVLDAGAGQGPYRRLFDHLEYESADFLALDRPYARPTYECDLTSIPVEDGRFDAVICTQVLEHVPNPAAVLAEFNRVLAPAGRVYLSAPLFFAEHNQPFDFFRYTRFAYPVLADGVGLQVDSLAWLEGYDATLSYQLGIAATSLPRRLVLVRLLLGALARWFARRDVRRPDRERGMCKNYRVVLSRRAT